MMRTILILLSVLPYPLRRDLRTNFYRYYLRSIYSLKSGNVDRAEEMANAAYSTVRNKKEAFLALYLLGTIKAYKNSWARAKYYLENALSLAESRDDSVLLEPWMLYVSYYDDGLYSTYELAKSFNTAIPEEKIFKALYLVSEERYEDALQVIGNISGHNALYIRSYVFYKMGMLDSALYYMSGLSEFNNIERLFYATLLFLNGDYEKANSVVKLVEKNDVYSVLLQALVESELGSDDLVKTYNDYKDILMNKPEFGKIALMVAEMYFKHKKYRDVVNVLDESIEHMEERDRKIALFYLGTSYVLLKRYAGAVKVWKEYLKYPDTGHYDYAHFQLGRSAYELELDSIAKEHLIRLHDTSSYYFWGLYLYSRILIKENLYNLAQPILAYITGHKVERSLRRRVYYNLGKIFVKWQKWDSAMVNFRKMLQLGFKGSDIDSAEYLYEYCRLQLGEYSGPVELNLEFSKKYPHNSMVLSLLDEVFTYFMTASKIDSAFSVLLKRRALASDSIYEVEFKTFLEALKEKDTFIVDSLVNVIRSKGTDFEKMLLAKKLMSMGKYMGAIDILQGVSENKKRLALLLIAKSYDSMGKKGEKELVLRDIFPPYDSVGTAAFGELAISLLKNEGIDSFYNLVFGKNVPDTLKVEVLKRASSELIIEGDTLNALELKSRLKEITGDKDAVEEN